MGISDAGGDRFVRVGYLRRWETTMAAGFWSRPGTKNGPCVDESCGHIDCHATRLAAADACAICGEAIGYETLMYVTPAEVADGRGYVHASCLEAAYRDRT